MPPGGPYHPGSKAVTSTPGRATTRSNLNARAASATETTASASTLTPRNSPNLTPTASAEAYVAALNAPITRDR